MTEALNVYDVLITSGKYNGMYPEQEQIVSLTTVVNRLKDDNRKLSKYGKTASRNQKLKSNQSQTGSGNGKGNSNGLKDIKIRPQDKCELEALEYVDAQNGNIY